MIKHVTKLTHGKKSYEYFFLIRNLNFININTVRRKKNTHAHSEREKIKTKPESIIT